MEKTISGQPASKKGEANQTLPTKRNERESKWRSKYIKAMLQKSDATQKQDQASALGYILLGAILNALLTTGSDPDKVKRPVAKKHRKKALKEKAPLYL